MSAKSAKASIEGNSFDWDLIAGTIQEQKCVLFIGPAVFANEQFPRLEEWMADFLQKEPGDLIKKYYAEDALFAFKDPSAKTKATFSLKKFFQEEDFSHVKELYRKIAEIPFSMIFTLTPDDLMQQVFEEKKVNYQPDFYLKNQPPRQVDTPITPTANSPLLYNLFGFMQNRDSLVLTHDDLFDYLNSILTQSSMHPDIMQMIKKMENFIFLGISFDKWYMRLLLKMLYRLQGRDEFLRFANASALTEDIKTLFVDQYRIEFVPQEIQEFVDQLHKVFEDKGLLRKESEKKQSITGQLKELVGEGKVSDAITGLQTYIDRFLTENTSLPESSLDMLNGLSSELLQLRSMFRRLENRKRQGIISEDKSDLEMNQITHSLIGYLDEIGAMNL
ncbi:MAG: SIR2 family protein [Saprospirales bacterium]|nr:SIR2 family protein [Saprospirales bacterium]MBK8492985.1 SIR2 family protein [Saprospirales bacterium]